MLRPWTDDTVLQSYFFTNPYRENDKVTVWFRKNIREPLRYGPGVFFATVAFRWFNLPDTAIVLMDDNLDTCPKDIDHWEYPGNLLTHWDPQEALDRLSIVRAIGGKVFTGAYMINSPGGEPKLEAIIRRITNVWEYRKQFTEVAWEPNLTMEGVHKALTQFDGMGGFMAYEVVCDLRYTYFLENAPDKLTWCHIGPGARRGLYRVLGIPFPKGDNSAGCPQILKPSVEMAEMKKLLYLTSTRLSFMPPFEMREIEHSLCEFDKYERLRLGDGRAKRTYKGV